MLAIIACVALVQTPSSQQVYDEMRAVLNKAQGVSFEFGHVMGDAWESEASVFARRPNIFSLVRLGETIESDGKWRYETGGRSNGTSLTPVTPKTTLYGFWGFESFFYPQVKPTGEGFAQEVELTWQANAKAWRINLSYPDQADLTQLYVDPTTKLPLGWAQPKQGAYYYKRVKLYARFDKPPRSVAPPSVKELRANVRNALASYKTARFFLQRDRDVTEKFDISRSGKYTYSVDAKDRWVEKPSKKKAWEIRELFGWEEFLGQKSKLKYEEPPSLRYYEPGQAEVWVAKCSYPGSSKTINVFFHKETWMPVGYELLMNRALVRSVVYEKCELAR